MKIRVIYDPILREKTAPVSIFDAELKKQADEMLSIMQSNAGIGLAANQVGLNKQLIVLGYKKSGEDDEMPNLPFMQLVNPTVIKFSKEKETLTEGCLSLPGLELPVTRSVGVIISAQDLNGKPVRVKAKGLLARVLQHEIDHLNGVLFTDRATRKPAIPNDLQFAKIVFIGSDDFSAEVYRTLHDAGLNIIAIITETDKKSGRGQILTEPIMKQLGKEHAVAVFQPETAKEISDIMQQFESDLLVLASYGKILTASSLEIPTYGALNVHPSLLPKYRGATPIQSSILNGDTETGVTIMTMSPQVDAGGIVAQTKVTIDPNEDFSDLKKRLAQIGSKLLLTSLPTYLAGQANILPQNPHDVTSTTKLTKEMGEIDWQESIDQIHRQIRALNPWPGSFTWLEGKRLKILKAKITQSKLEPIMVQLEGKKATNWPDFIRGYKQQLTKTTWYGTIVQDN